MTKPKFKYLPYSGRRYKVSPCGIVVDSNDDVLALGNDDVDITWMFGKRKYSVALLVILTYKTVLLPDHLWLSIEPLYKDGDSNNRHISNLTYRFKNGPIEVGNYPGYYYIPFFCNYGISKSGEVVNLTTGKIKKWAKTKPCKTRNSTGGYLYSRLVDDSGKSRVVFVHRALCFAFKRYSGNVDELVVNHIDGDPENNDIPNLEFCTYFHNSEHALNNGLRVKVKPVLMKDLTTGEIVEFRSASLCGKYLGFVSGDPIKSAINKKRILIERYVFKYRNGESWFKDEDYREYVPGKDMVGLNVVSGELIIFSGVYQGNALTGVSNATILRHCKTQQSEPTRGYIFRYYSDLDTLSEHSKTLSHGPSRT